MRRSFAEQLRRYPATLVAALVRPQRLQPPGAAAGRWCPPATFAAVSGLAGYVLSALLADDGVVRHYEWQPALAPLMRPLTALPGSLFLIAAGLTAAGIAAAAAIAYPVLRIVGAQVSGQAYIGAFLYFAGGPMALVATLVHSIGLPVTLGAVISFPGWLAIALPAALAIYLVWWLAVRIGALPGVAWWHGLLAAAVAAAVYIAAPPDPVAVLRLEPYAMTVDSMAPQVGAGSVSIANRAVLGWRQPAAGDLVVFRKVVGGSEVAVLRRVVGLAGDTVELRDGRLAVNGVPAGQRAAEDARVVRETLPSGASYDIVAIEAGAAGGTVGPVQVPAAHVYVLSDNRGVAVDSRQFGPLAVQELDGVVYYQLAPERRPLR